MNWKTILYNACRGENLDLVQYVSEHVQLLGVNVNWDSCLYYAHLSYNLRLIQYLIDKGATSLDLSYVNDTELYETMVTLIVEKAKKDHIDIDYDNGLNAAAAKGNQIMALYLIKNGATDINYALAVACMNAKFDFVLFLIRLAAAENKLGKFNFNDALRYTFHGFEHNKLHVYIRLSLFLIYFEAGFHHLVLHNCNPLRINLLNYDVRGWGWSNNPQQINRQQTKRHMMLLLTRIFYRPIISIVFFPYIPYV